MATIDKFGYDLAKASSLSSKVILHQNNLQTYFLDEYTILSNTLRREWIGIDEYDYEQKLVEEINKVYYKITTVSKNVLLLTQYNINTWIDYQKGNNISGESRGNSLGYVNMNSSSIVLNNKLIVPKFSKISSDSNRGIHTSKSYETINNSLTTFNERIKNKIMQFVSLLLNVEDVVFGDSQSPISKYINSILSNLNKITGILKEIIIKVSKLTKQNYTEVSNEVSIAVVEAISKMDRQLSGATSRWV